MQLRTNGPVVSAYRWLYGIGRYDLKNNFCPIFWMMVLGAFLIVPYAIFCLPVVLSELYDKNYENGDRSFGERIGISLAVYFCIFLAWSVGQFFAYLFGYYASFDMKLIPLGAIVTIALIGLTSGYFFHQYTQRLKRKKQVERWAAEDRGEKIPDSIGTIIKNIWSAFYDKHCPRITWLDPTEKTYTDAMDAAELEPVEGMELSVHTDPILGTTYELKNINNTDSEKLDFPNLNP